MSREYIVTTRDVRGTLMSKRVKVDGAAKEARRASGFPNGRRLSVRRIGKK